MDGWMETGTVGVGGRTVAWGVEEWQTLEGCRVCERAVGGLGLKYESCAVSLPSKEK